MLKQVAKEGVNDEQSTSVNKINTEFPILERIDVIENTNANNIENISTRAENEQFSSIASNELLNSMSFEGVVLIPHENSAAIFNDPLEGLCNLEDTNSQPSSKNDCIQTLIHVHFYVYRYMYNALIYKFQYLHILENM